MVKGEAPFDLAKAKTIFATYADAASKLDGLFPPNSKTGDKTTAAPKIWEDMAGFKAAAAKFGSQAKAAGAAVKDLNSFKAQFGEVQKNCGGCHQTYRVKKS
jgi:cytochrome c556